MDIIFASLTSYFVIAIPITLVLVGVLCFIKRISMPRAAKVSIFSAIVFLALTPMMGGGGAALVTLPYPAIGKMLDINYLAWHYEKWPIFTVLTIILSLVTSALISIKLVSNKSFNQIGAKDAPPD